MEGYDSRQNVKEFWTYTELLEMVYIEDLKAINEYNAQKEYDEQRELEELLKTGK